MAQIAVLHNTLDFQGGADVVCLSVCAALQRDHDVTLYTLSETTPRALAERFEIDLDADALDVRMPRGAVTAARTLSAAAPAIGPQLAFRSVLLRAVFERDAARFDLAVSTANELSLSIPSVQYVHYPQFGAHRSTDAAADPLDRLWSRLAGPGRAELVDSGGAEHVNCGPGELAGDVTLLANSAWTADVVADRYGVTPTVLHPPVDPIDAGRDWHDREDGVVVVGRLAPDKRALAAIRVVDGVRERGRDLHLHIVGSAPRAYRQYAGRVAAAAAERSYVTVERDASRERLESLLGTHKYGLNLKPEEHFGMSVAEYVAAGMVAFAPDSGGQREILDERDDRLFGSESEAVDLLLAAVDADDPPALPPDRFAAAQFRDEIRRTVDRALH